jgi:hypothetical protein
MPGGAMEFLLKQLIRTALKYGENYDRLQAFARASEAKGADRIPLEPYPNWLEGVFQAFFFVFGVIFVIAGWVVFSDTGFSLTFLYVLLGLGGPCALLLLMLFNTDSRYVLDMKNKRVLYVFTFFVKVSETVVTTFSNTKSIELDAQEVGRTVAGNWVFSLSLVTKTFERISLTRQVYCADELPRIGQLIADTIKCPFKEGEKIEKMRIMGL